MVELSLLAEFVNNQASFHRDMIAKYEGNERRQKRHIETAALFDDLAEFLQNLPGASVGVAPNTRLALSWDEVEDLPPELLAELSVGDGDKAEFQILSVIEKLGGVASLDRILVELWRTTNEVCKRAAITNRLYRMGQKQLIFPVAGKKGVYALTELSEEEAASLV